MRKKTDSSIFLIAMLLLVALVSSLILVMKNQDSRKGAFFAGADMLILGYEDALEMETGDDVEIQWFIDSKERKRVTASRMVLCYGPELELFDESNREDVSSSVEILSPEFFDFQMSVIRDYEGKKCLNSTVMTMSNDDTDLSLSMIPVAKIKFKAVLPGSGTFEINKELSGVVGINKSSDDNVIEIEEVFSRDYEVSEGRATGTVTLVLPSPTVTVVPTVAPTGSVGEPSGVIDFRMSFTGLKNKEAICGQHWPVDVIVLGEGETAVYNDVDLTMTDRKTDKGEVVFETSLSLEEFEQRENLAVFVKGPQHVQMKYAKDGQIDFYGKAGGEIRAFDEGSPSFVYDWSGYPALAGDVTGVDEGVSDGRVDGRDFAYIKSKISVERGDPVEVDVHRADFDGDCMVGNVDLAIMMLSLVERLDQLY